MIRAVPAHRTPRYHSNAMTRTTTKPSALLAAREALDLSRVALAKRVRCSVRAIGTYECGVRMPSRRMLERLRKALGAELFKAERRFGKVKSRERGRAGEERGS